MYTWTLFAYIYSSKTSKLSGPHLIVIIIIVIVVVVVVILISRTDSDFSLWEIDMEYYLARMMRDFRTLGETD